MRGGRGYFGLSAQQVDPLSWFTGPLVPLAFAALTALYGGTVSIVTWTQAGIPLLQPVALVLCVGANVLIHAVTRPLRQPIGWVTGALALAISALGVVISAVGYAGSSFAVEQWWASIALALTIASLGPYLPARTVFVLGASSTVVAVAASTAILYPVNGNWGPGGSALITAYPPLVALAATVTFSYIVVSTMMPMLENPSRTVVVTQPAGDDAARLAERVAVARLTARAAPFLQRIADAGRIEPADRALAGQLARRLRDELVTQSNLSWLDSVAAGSRLVVVDPDQLARRMNNTQRTALRALLGAILDIPATDTDSLMVELRKAQDGATAVGVSLDMALPEGTRIMHLAPYYLTLKTAVRDLAIDRDKLRLTFSIEPES
jgi:hypothetical protein